MLRVRRSVRRFEHDSGREAGMEGRRRVRSFGYSALAGLLVLALGPITACGPGDSGTADGGSADAGAEAPTGQVWALQSVSGDNARQIEHPDRYTIEFKADGTYGIRADCNSGGGTYTFENGTLTVREGPLTLAACGPESYSAGFLEGLSNITSYERNGGAMVLTAADGSKMHFAPLPTSASLGGAEGLAGTQWQVTGYNNGRGGVTSPVAATELTVDFGADGSVSGSAGCNSFAGTYAVDDADGIAFTPLAATRKMCPGEDVMGQESQFLAALANATNWEIRGDRLQLRDNSGALQVDLRR
jgi:heat shock protein HslJ